MRTWKLDIDGAGRPGKLALAGGSPVGPETLACLDEWKKRLQFSEGPPRQMAFVFFPGGSRDTPKNRR